MSWYCMKRWWQYEPKLPVIVSMSWYCMNRWWQYEPKLPVIGRNYETLWSLNIMGTNFFQTNTAHVFCHSIFFLFSFFFFFPFLFIYLFFFFGIARDRNKNECRQWMVWDPLVTEYNGNQLFSKQTPQNNDIHCHWILFFFLFSFLSPPVQIALWAHMRHFLSVCLSVCCLSSVWTWPKVRENNSYLKKQLELVIFTTIYYVYRAIYKKYQLHSKKKLSSQNVTFCLNSSFTSANPGNF